MELPFLTIGKYAGRTLKPFGVQAARGGGHALGWNENASEGKYGMVFTKVRNILAERGETVSGLAELKYHDKKGFGNRVFRIDTEKRQYFLKILGDSQGNRRELFVWKALGYETNGRRVGKPWIPGLPAEVFALEQLNSVLMPFYPGQLREIHGGGYELPMVLALLLYLDETLACMHREGLVFMDLCPENILYGEQSEQSPITFFLADMGSVKTVIGTRRDDQHWQRLCETVTAQRVTRAETRPPEDLFPETDSCEESPGYDRYALARTALILMGFEDIGDIAALSNETYNLEQPMKPLGQELHALLGLLEAPLSGKPSDREALYALFRNFFLERARFAARHLDNPDFRKLWQDLLLGRLTRYRMALNKEDRQQLPEMLNQIFETPATEGLGDGLARLQRLPECLLQQDWDGALEALEIVASSPILDMSRTARYAYQYHKKLLKTMARGHAGVADIKALDRHAPCLEQLPEKATLDALRRGQKPELAFLRRQMIETEGVS